MTTIVFTATTPQNTPSAYRASTSANPNPMISPAFVEANYEVLESLLNGRKGSRGGIMPKVVRPSEIVNREKGNIGVNLPPLLAAHLRRNESGQLLQSSLTSVHGGHQPLTNIGGNLPPNGSVTPFVRWIEDYPLLNGLKMPSHIGSYDGKGDTDNFLHLFEGAIHMQKWLMPVACHMFTYTLKESARIWWNSQKAGSILNYEDLKAKFRSHFSQQKKFTKTHLAVHNIKQREGESTRAFVTRYTDDTLQILGKTLKDQENSLRTITEDIKVEIDHGHDTNDCRQLRNQIEEDVKSGQLSHLVKGIKKERDDSYTKNNALEGFTSKGREITFPSRGSNSLAPVVIKAKIFRREVSRVHMDSRSSCESSGEIPLEIIIGDAPLARKETLNFVIAKSNLPYNILLGRTSMQKMVIIVSTIHGAIQFHTTKGIGTVFSTYESDKVKEGMKKVRETPPTSEKGVFSCIVAEEKEVVNNKYPEQTITIGRQLSKHFKGRLRDLLRANAYIFAWTHADMTVIPRTIMVEGKPFYSEIIVE
ncbi:reverse transcriptase domain-containing protein [Tanacetum coccineum]